MKRGVITSDDIFENFVGMDGRNVYQSLVARMVSGVV